MTTPEERAEAAASLEGLRADRAAMADQARQPWWYDPALGFLVFELLASLSTRNPFAIVGALVVFAAGVRFLRWSYNRAAGFWVDGRRPGPTQRAIRVYVACYAVLLPIAAVLELLGVRGAFAVVGAVLGVVIALVSRYWTTIYQRELRGEL